MFLLTLTHAMIVSGFSHFMERCLTRLTLRLLREDTHKKVFFLVVGPPRFYPPYTNGLVVHAPFFIIA